MTFFTSSISFHTLERVALALLGVLAVLAVGLSSTSNGEEAEAPMVVSGPTGAPPPPPMSVSTIGVEPELADIQSWRGIEEVCGEPKDASLGMAQAEEGKVYHPRVR
jgi:hypothetical protein